MRLNRFLAQAGCGSRRACEALIREERVTINGVTVTDLATQVEEGAHVKVGNRLLRNEAPITAILHKPRGYICTADDPEGRKTIYELLPAHWPRVFYVGRLDADSEGLLVVTNDGELGQRLTHPSYKLPKSYEVTLEKDFDFNDAPKLLKGLFIEGKRAKLEELHRINPSKVKVVLTQGIKRQIRLMFLTLGYNVRRLVRTEIGKLKLGSLPVGEWEILSKDDVRRCFGDGSVKPVSRPPKKSRPFFRKPTGSRVARPAGARPPAPASASAVPGSKHVRSAKPPALRNVARNVKAPARTARTGRPQNKRASTQRRGQGRA